MWVEFVVGSLLCSERFFSGYSGFPLSSKTNISKFQFDLECTDISERVLVNSLVLRGWTNYIYIFISSDFESVFAKDPTGKILSFVFYPKAVYFECKFWFSRSAITNAQNWPIGHQRVGSRENDVIYSACKRNVLYMQNTGLKVWKPETSVLHINSAEYRRIAFLN